jgi:hypothetical protein
MSDTTNSSSHHTLTWIPLVLGVGSYFLAFFASITDLYPARWLLGTVSFLLFGIFLLRSIYYLFRARYVEAFSYVLPHIAFVLILASVGVAGRLAGSDIQDVVRLKLFSQTACIQSAMDLGHGAAFGVCVWHHDDLSVTANLIVYDSSDEIALPAESRSLEWTKVASRLSLVGQLNFRARRMVDHFYDVDFFEGQGD